MFKQHVINGELDISNRSNFTINHIKYFYIDLSDMHSTELAKYIKCSGSYVKKLNLSKNRLSDEGMNVIIKAICES